MIYEIEQHAEAQLEVRHLKRALREAEDKLREYEQHSWAQKTSDPPRAVIVDGCAVTLNRTSHAKWEYTVAEVVAP